MRTYDGTFPTVARMRQHVMSLAAENHIRVEVTPILTRSHANPRDRVITIPVIKGPISYAIALHELGHVVHPLGHSMLTHRSYFAEHGFLLPSDHEVKLLDELFAYEWAFKRALCWTPSMTRVYRYGLWSHESRAKECAQSPILQMLDLIERSRKPRKQAA